MPGSLHERSGRYLENTMSKHTPGLIAEAPAMKEWLTRHVEFQRSFHQGSDATFSKEMREAIAILKRINGE